jgi:hypothetical protein
MIDHIIIRRIARGKTQRRALARPFKDPAHFFYLISEVQLGQRVALTEMAVAQ